LNLFDDGILLISDECVVVMMMVVQSLPVLALPETESDSVVLMTTGLSGDDRGRASRWIKALGWARVDDYTCQGEV